MRIVIGGPAIGAALKDAGVRAATAHDVVTVRGAVENYDAQFLCMGQNVFAPTAANTLTDIWLDLSHYPASNYGLQLQEIVAHESH